MNIEKPVFIIGSGRSGTTILYNLLALHPQLCWFSNLTDKFPRLPQLSIVHRVLDMPVVAGSMRREFVRRTRPSLRPGEGDNIYHYCGFDDKTKMTKEDLTAEMQRKFTGVIKNYLQATGKERFLNKQTANTQRIQVIDKMFPDAFYIHIIRDGRAVANSLLHVDWWDDIVVWWLGYGPSDWASMGKEPIELCGLHWQRDVQEILENRHLFEDRYLELRYEELVEDTHGIMKRLLPFCELDDTPTFFRYLPKSMPSMNRKWETELDERQQLVLWQTIGDFMVQLGYSV